MPRLLSLFSGSGGFELAATLCGISPSAASEVEPYPIAVTKSRFPTMTHLGSVTDVNGAEIEPVDIITFGSPCQDLSVAGKRAGLKHEDNGDDETTRSGLFMEAVRIIKEMRKATNGRYPTFVLWENVPGAYSSNGGDDFRIVLEELIKIVEPTATVPAPDKNGWPYADAYVGDGWSVAYRTLDAQYWGVPQRRRRIYLVADFRGERAAKVLFEREGLRGYSAQSGTPWQGTAADAEGCTGADDREGERNCLTPWDVQSRRIFSVNGAWPALYSGEGGGKGYVAIPTEEKGTGLDGYNQALTGDKSKTLVAAASDYHHVPCVIEEKGFDGYNGDITGDVAATLGVNCGLTTGRNGIIESVGFKELNSAQAGDNQMAVAYSIENHPADSRVNIDDSGKVQTLTSRMGTGGGNVPMVMEEKQTVYCLQGNGIDRADTAGCNGKGVKEDVCYTLNTIDRPAVAYGLDRASFNQGQNAKFDFTVTEEQQPTLTARGPGAVAQPVLHASKASFFMRTSDGPADTLVATDYKDPQIVTYKEDTPIIEQKPHYIVRRLTPTECARLQGFPDLWGHPDKKEDLTDEEYRFWLEVRNTHAAINGKQTKDYTKAQILKWYNGLHTDSAEYKMWGNGIALPTALYVMQGIAEQLNAPMTDGEEGTEEVTDLSDAPEDIKEAIIENAEMLEQRAEDSAPSQPQDTITEEEPTEKTETTEERTTPTMEKLNMIQKRNNLNAVYRVGDRKPGGDYSDYYIYPAEADPNTTELPLAVLEFQDGPRLDPNSRHGILDHELLEIVRDRLKGFQSGPYATRENACALTHIEEALMWMNKRVEDRAERGVLGKMEK